MLRKKFKNERIESLWEPPMNFRGSRKARIEEILFPRLWMKEVSEESVLSLISYHMPLRPVIARLLQKFIDPESKSSLLLSGHFLGKIRSAFPGYYSDKEKTILLLNQFLTEKKNWEASFKWILYLDERKEHPYVHLLLGIALLDQYLHRLDQEIWLTESIKHLERALPYFEMEESKKTLRALLAFGYYMMEEYDASSQVLKEEASKVA
jgi:hypothetical protein